MSIIPVNPTFPDPKVLDTVVERIRKGGVVGYPTETVYGLGVYAPVSYTHLTLPTN